MAFILTLGWGRLFLRRGSSESPSLGAAVASVRQIRTLPCLRCCVRHEHQGQPATKDQWEASQAAPGGIIMIDGLGRVVTPGSYEESHPEQVGGISRVWVDG